VIYWLLSLHDLLSRFYKTMREDQGMPVMNLLNIAVNTVIGTSYSVHYCRTVVSKF